MINRHPSLENTCTACCACYNACPEKAISILADKEGFYYPLIDHDTCINCDLCHDVCPELNAIEQDESQQVQTAYYGWHKDEQVRKQSSSGGIFSALSEEILQENGMVFGAVHDIKNQIVRHGSNEFEGLDALRKSKYVQSFIGDSFSKVRSKIISGQKILFVGTPCQIAGLNSFLGKEYPNLLTCDLVCHGVPPMQLLNDHLLLYEEKKKSKITHVDFRPKTNGWSKYLLKLTFLNQKEYERPGGFDAYFKAFFQNLSLRKSCFNCQYSNRQHLSDITLADFWGFRRLDPKINDEKGLSLILINTRKGDAYFKKLKNTFYHPVPWEIATYVFGERNDQNYNVHRRNQFFHYYCAYGWKKAIKQYRLSGSTKARLKVWLKGKIKEKLS
ncbi:MAG: Coenzyme F420 hydrogenase/dehydrogenase, beta subunit C-terminal domain [Desulfobacterium sp.]|nr:Coenzyme F420 hydrogenase/dehydrogenase, beta subunit C-terminal domain [Desulfobacterium sp.]